MALTSGANEATWLRRLLQSLGHTQSEPTVLHGDNQERMKLAHNPRHRARKSILICAITSFANLSLTKSSPSILHSDNLADNLIKNLSPFLFQGLTQLYHPRHIPFSEGINSLTLGLTCNRFVRS